MYAVGRLGSYIQRGVYRVSDPFHPFGGAVDIIVVQQEDGSFKSSRWNVRFGKFQGVLKAKERIVRISVNGVEADFNMYLDHKGEAYFLREFDEEEGESLMHPTTFPGDDTDDCSEKKKRAFNSGSCNFEARMSNSADQFDVGKGKVLTRAGSRRSGILGFVFGRSSMKAGEYNEGDHGPALTRVDSLERAEFAADLLEVNWSTNLTSLRPQKKVSSGFCALVNTENKSTTNVETGDSDGNVCYNKEQVGFSAESSFQDCDGFVGETISLSTSDQAVERPEVGGNMSELIVEVSEDTGAHTNRLGLHKPSVELEYCPDKHLVEEKNSSENIVGLPAIKIYKEEFTTDDTQLYVHSKPLESSNRALQNSTEVMNLASERSRSIHIHNELFHTTSAMLPQVTHTEESDPQKGQKGSPESNSQQTDITCSCVNDFNDADAQRSPMSTKPETINPDHCISSSSDFSNMCYETHCRNDTRDIDIPNMFGSPLESANNYDLTEAILKPPSISSEEENFIFGDLEEYKIIEGQCTKSFLREQVDQDNPPWSLDATEKNSQLIGTNACLPSSRENFVEDRETSDQENFRVRSSPIHIQRNHSLDGDLVGLCTVSLPVMSSHSCNLSQRGIHHPRSLSVDLRSKSFSWEFHGKCMGGDEDKEKQLLNDKQTKNMDISGMVNTIDASTTVEISLCKHLLSEGMGASAAAEAFDSEKLDVEKFRSLGPQVVKDEKLVVRIGHCYFPWDAAAPIILGMASFGSERIFEAKGMIPINKNLDGDPSNSSIPSNGNWSLWPFSFRKSRSQKAISSLENLSEIPIEIDEKVQIYPKLTKKTVKAYAPTSEQLASLNLKEGRNIVTFTFCTAMLGNQQVDARIYLWKWNTRIVISDVDGTITKSDVLGQFMPLVGIDSSQTGVAHLFSAIKENGYQLLFLSARAISQAFRTRRFLFNLKQDGKALPDGPVFISPDGFFPSLYREVIRRAPHEFKIACLEDIKSLFPAGCNPFYAGFGNRYTDEISYRKVGIPKGKIFIINPKGEVAVNRRLDTKSYTSLHALVNGMFPPMNSSEQEDYNAWNYWKLPPPDIDI